MCNCRCRKNGIVAYACAGALIGAACGALIDMSIANARYHYAVDLTTNKLHFINLDFISIVLANHDNETLLTYKNELKGIEAIKNKQEKDKATEIIINKYIPIINAHQHGYLKQSHYQSALMFDYGGAKKILLHYIWYSNWQVRYCFHLPHCRVTITY